MLTNELENFVGPLRRVSLLNGLYFIFENGQIYSPDRLVRCKNGYRTVKGRFLKHRTDSNGYKYVSLCDAHGNEELHRIHRLMMLCFNPICNYNELVVNHIDGKKDNNRLDNLEWCTKAENNLHARKIGLHTTPYVYKDYMEAIFLLREMGWSNAKIGRAMGKSADTVKSNLKTLGITKSQKGRIGGKFC